MDSNFHLNARTWFQHLAGTFASLVALFKSQSLMAENETNALLTVEIVHQIKAGQINCWFLMRGENLSTRGKKSEQRLD